MHSSPALKRTVIGTVVLVLVLLLLLELLAAEDDLFVLVADEDVDDVAADEEEAATAAALLADDEFVEDEPKGKRRGKKIWLVVGLWKKRDLFIGSPYLLLALMSPFLLSFKLCCCKKGWLVGFWFQGTQ